MNQADHEQLEFGSIKNLFMFVCLQISQTWVSVLDSFNKQAEPKQKKIVHEQARDPLGLIQNNSSINSFISLYVLAKYTHYTYLNNDMANMGPLLITLIFSFPLH